MSVVGVSEYVIVTAPITWGLRNSNLGGNLVFSVNLTKSN